MRWQEESLKLATLRQESDCHAQNYEVSHASQGTHSEPVLNYVVLIETAERAVKGLLRKVAPVARLRNYLKISQSERYRIMYYIMEMYYFEKWKLEHVAEHLQKSVKTLARRKYELVNLTMEELQKGVLEYEIH